MYVLLTLSLLFFFEQKTAYEVRISDWSSDVCSSDLGVGKLKEEVDTLIVVPNDRLLEISDRGISMIEAFATADQVLLAGVQGITDLITTPGLINLDFADVKSVMQGAGSALMGIGSARGADRAIKAAELAVESPLLEDRKSTRLNSRH